MDTEKLFSLPFSVVAFFLLCTHCVNTFVAASAHFAVSFVNCVHAAVQGTEDSYISSKRLGGMTDVSSSHAVRTWETRSFTYKKSLLREVERKSHSSSEAAVMSATAQAQQSANKITLRGSTEIVTEFFGFSINSILYQRGIYPPESFSHVNKYGLSMLVTKDDGLKKYLSQVLTQLYEWLMQKTVQKVVIVITGASTQEVLERWVFDVETCDKSMTENSNGKDKAESEIVSEIQAIIRQITACVTFLPILNEPCTFDMLVYTDEDCDVPETWEESDPKYVTNAEDVRLRSFTTKVHKVDASVSYRNDQADFD